MTIFNDKTVQDILDQIIAEGPVMPAELEQRSGVMLYNHLRILTANLLKEFLDLTVLHDETRQITAETIVRLDELSAFIRENPSFSFPKSEVRPGDMPESLKKDLIKKMSSNPQHQKCAGCPHVRFGHNEEDGCTNFSCRCTKFIEGSPFFMEVGN